MAASAKALDEKKRVTNVTTDELKEAHLIARLKYKRAADDRAAHARTRG